MFDPIAFSIFGIDIRWYGLLIGLGVLIAIRISSREAIRLGEKEEVILDLVIFGLPAAIIGARLYYIIFEWEYYRYNMAEIIAIRNGGLAIHGGIIAAFLTGYIYCKKRKINFLKMADIVAPGLVLAQAIGRWGNYFNQEAYGSVVSVKFISKFPEFIKRQMFISGQYYHPTFLYESIWDVCIFIFLIFYSRKFKRVHGELIALYAMAYSAGRFFIEGLRVDSLMLGNLRIAQVVSILLFAGGLFLFLKIRKVNE